MNARGAGFLSCVFDELQKVGRMRVYGDILIYYDLSIADVEYFCVETGVRWAYALPRWKNEHIFYLEWN